MSLSDIVNLTIVESSQAVSRPGFGTMLIFAPTPYTNQLVRSYSSIAGMISDGFAADDVAVLAAGAVFGQNPHSPSVKIGKCTSLPTTTVKLTATVANSMVYSFLLCTQAAPAGTLVSYTSDSSATLAEINAGLLAVVNGLSVGITASDQTTYLRLQGNAAGTVFHVASVSSNIAVIDASADSSFAAQLAAIQQEDSDWYALGSVFRGDAQVQVLATFAEANRKLFICATKDSDIPVAGSGDLASSLQTANHARTALLHAENPMQFGDCAWAGRNLSQDPGSETWKFTTLAGVSSEKLTDSQQAECALKNCNDYIALNGRSFTQEGVVSSGEFIDVIRFIDWLYTNLQLDIFARLVDGEKLPYTDQGAMVLKSIILARLQQGVAAGGIVKGSITITVPKAADQNPSDRAKRFFPGITFTALLAGAIHAVKINGTVSV